MKKNLWESYAVKNCPMESAGLRLHIERGIDPVLRRKFLFLAKQLRKCYVFPVPVSVYVVASGKVTLRSGESAYGSFRWFPRRTPMIRVAAAYEESALEEYGKAELDVMILSSLLHELTHYYQYCSGLEQSTAVSERQANHFRYSILEQLMPETETNYG